MSNDVQFHINYLVRGQTEVVIVVDNTVHTVTKDIQQALKIAYRLGKKACPLSDNG